MDQKQVCFLEVNAKSFCKQNYFFKSDFFFQVSENSKSWWCLEAKYRLVKVRGEKRKNKQIQDRVAEPDTGSSRAPEQSI